MKPGDRVALFMLDHADLVSVYLAVIAAGGVAVAVSTRAPSDDLRHTLASGLSPSSAEGPNFDGLEDGK